MCLAELHLSTLPCGHRYYRLLRPCTPGHNLLNCPKKLALSGWETRSPSCPFCNPVDANGEPCAVDHTTNRLITETSLGLTTRVARSSSLADTRRLARDPDLSNVLKRHDSYGDAPIGTLPPSPSVSGPSTSQHSPPQSVSSLTATTPSPRTNTSDTRPHLAQQCPIATSTSLRNQAALARIDTYFSLNRGIVPPNASGSYPDSASTVIGGGSVEALSARRGSTATSMSGTSGGSPGSSATSPGAGIADEDLASETSEASSAAMKGSWSRRDSAVASGYQGKLGQGSAKEKGYGQAARKKSLKEAVRKGKKLSIGLFK